MTALGEIRHVVFDMDGTIYLGGTLLPHTLDFLAALSTLGIGYSFVTNNCSHSRAEYVNRLAKIGISAYPETIWTSAHATTHYLSTELPTARRIFVHGTPGLKEDIRFAGFEVVSSDPDAVVVGFDTGLNYEDLCQTAYWISRGLPYVATHPDRVCPTDRRIVMPDCAAVCALFETATGRRPQAVPGKPNKLMIEGVFARHRLLPHQVALIGDRLYTDMRMARDAGAIAVLTLTGETRREELAECPEHSRPDLVIANLGVLQQELQMAQQSPTTGNGS